MFWPMVNRNILITGGSQGIGRATALLLAERGNQVTITGRNLDTMEKVAAKSENIQAIVADVSKESDVISLFDQLEKKEGLPHGLPHCLVNNAGLVEVGFVEDFSIEAWRQVFATNVEGMFLCSREMFRRWKAKDSSEVSKSIVNISSTAGIVGAQKIPGLACYSASKHAVVGLTASLALEGKRYGIRVNCIAPGATDTEMLKKAAPHIENKMDPIDVAKSIAYLCDEDESFRVNAAVIEVPTP